MGLRKERASKTGRPKVRGALEEELEGEKTRVDLIKTDHINAWISQLIKQLSIKNYRRKTWSWNGKVGQRTKGNYDQDTLCVHTWDFQGINKKFKRNNGFFISLLLSCSLCIMNSNFILYVQFANATLLLVGYPSSCSSIDRCCLFCWKKYFYLIKTSQNSYFLLILNTSLKESEMSNFVGEDQLLLY